MRSFVLNTEKKTTDPTRIAPLPLPQLDSEDRKTLMGIKVVASQYIDRQGREGLSVSELQSRLWANIVDMVIESVLKEKVAIKRFRIDSNRQTLQAEGYTETTAQLAQNTADAQQEFFGEVPSRTKADNQTWLELNNWAVKAEIGSAKLWSSPPDTPNQSYPGSTSAEDNYAKEQFFSFFWLYIKISESEVLCYQFRAWPNVAQIAQIQDKLGFPPPPGDVRLQERIVRNLITLSPDVAQEYSDYATYVEQIIYQDQNLWFDQPEDLTDSQRLRFWSEVKILFDTIFLPNALSVLMNLPDFNQFLEIYRESQDYLRKVNELASTFTVFYSALVNWFTTYKKKGEKTYSFADEKPKKELAEMMKLQFTKASGQLLTIKEQRREKKIFNKLFSLAGTGTSLFHCISMSPLSVAYQLSQMQNNLSALELEKLILSDHVSFHGYYVPREKGWRFIKAKSEHFNCNKCAGRKNCEVIGPCDVCAECDPRAIKIEKLGKKNLKKNFSVNAVPKKTTIQNPHPKRQHATLNQDEATVRVPLEALFNGGLELIRGSLIN
jgi:hypothetical protein